MNRFGGFLAAALAAAMLWPASAHANDNNDGLKSSVRGTVDVWERSRLNYDLAAVRSGDAAAPAVFATVLPEGIGSIRETQIKKRTFIRLVLPLVLESNNRILAKREHLEWLRAQDHLTAHDHEWIAELAHDYDLDPESEGLIGKLLHRVDVIPPSLAIAQSITESGWGSSRFARKGRALYGQRTWSRGGGIIPKERRTGETYEVKSFRSLLESVSGYMRNLNTHPAYKDLRNMRATMRAAEKTIDGYKLAEGLTRYAETGQQYVGELKSLIRVNRLRDFDDAELQTASERVAVLTN